MHGGGDGGAACNTGWSPNSRSQPWMFLSTSSSSSPFPGWSPIQEASLGCPRHHPSPASPPTSHPSPTSPLQAACSSCGVLSTTTTRRSLRTFSPRHSILKPEWRLWWPFRWQGILRGQVSDEATRDLPKFVTFLEKRVKVFCAHYLLYISISINILLLMFG